MSVKHIEKDLKAIVGRDNYLGAIEDRLTYAYDATGKECLPDAVIFPKNVKQVSKVLTLANARRIPIVARGAGSGLTGGAVPLSGGIVMVMNHFNRILSIDVDNLQAIVEPGVITADLHTAVEQKGLFYPPDPASMTFCTIGGNIAENAGGMRAVKYGVTQNFVMGLEVVMAGGEIIHTGSKCIKDVVGYDLTRLFVGSEGTLGIITRAILKLLPLPATRQTMTAAFGSLERAAKIVADIKKNGIIPVTLEFMDNHCIRAVESYLNLGLPKEAGALLLIEVDGKAREVEEDLVRVQKICDVNGALSTRIARDPDRQEELWRSRRSVHAALQQLRPKWEEEDISVPITKIPEMVNALEKISRTFGVIIPSFGHAGDGNIHVSIAAGYSDTPPENIDLAREEILKTTVMLEGRIAAEHGIGFVKRDKIGWNIDAQTLLLMQNIKRLMDPNGILNPCKIFPTTIQCLDKK